jgi:hypothetical protein
MCQLNAVQARTLLQGRTCVTIIPKKYFIALFCTMFLAAVVPMNAALTHVASLSSFSPSNQPTTGIEQIAVLRVKWCL